eukprot:5237048-Amphidinium_carterae.1
MKKTETRAPAMGSEPVSAVLGELACKDDGSRDYRSPQLVVQCREVTSVLVHASLAKCPKRRIMTTTWMHAA